jgi:hypothetical protein
MATHSLQNPPTSWWPAPRGFGASSTTTITALKLADATAIWAMPAQACALVELETTLRRLEENRRN